MTVALTILLVSLAGGFLYATGLFIGNSGWEELDSKVFWLAEAGMQRAIWNLKTTAGGGGQGENWTTVGVTENLGDGSYTMVVAAWDFALSANGSTASATSSSSGNPASNAIDGNNTTTYWESNAEPTGGSPQDLIITFPYTLTINKVRFIAPSSSTVPRDYQWAVSSNGVAYTNVGAAGSNNATLDVTTTFSVAANPAAASVNYLRLRVTEDGNGNPKRVRVLTVEVAGRRVTSTGTVTASGNTYTRAVRGTVVTDDASPQSQVAYKEPDWLEL